MRLSNESKTSDSASLKKCLVDILEEMCHVSLVSDTDSVRGKHSHIEGATDIISGNLTTNSEFLIAERN